jgi:hypothetical protein
MDGEARAWFTHRNILPTSHDIQVAGPGGDRAPDTFLGTGLQICRKLIDDGWFGEPIAATAFMTGHGSESWHPDPPFF